MESKGNFPWDKSEAKKKGGKKKEEVVEEEPLDSE